MAISLDNLTEYLDSQDWNYTVHEEKNYISLRMNMKTVDSCSLILDVIDDTTVLFYTVFPIKIPEERRAAVAEFLCRANYGLYHGNFEIDFRDGEIRYKTTGMTTEAEELDEEVIGRLVNLGFAMTDRYAPGILSVLYANDEPENAIARIENRKKDDEEQDS
ncbi:YbjN domain-containing protein [Intestinibacillus massiliensis]|uniref:YbjN domain-containing protein n=1 Tax=Intestinibacillus massiliensis TaxID=1871029 RepID=UPI000B34F15D|nr:YbjN domain-containing protein [Intestinibacillus massiliensis]MCB6365936.1 YbjN domain-containing protein [Intestinibacillus massiliensis]